MKICLIRSPTFVSEATYPTNIEYIAAVLKEEGHTVFFVDAEWIAMKKVKKLSHTNIFRKITYQILDRKKIKDQLKIVERFFNDPEDKLWDEIADHILETNPDVIGFSCFSASMAATDEIIKKIKQKNKAHIPIILGGIHPTSAPKETLQEMTDVNYLVIGEGELTVKELIKNIEQNSSDFSQIKGIAYRKDNQIIINPPRERIENLDTLPKLDFEYSQEHNNHLIMTSRGCPFNCKFCASKVMWGQRVRFRSPEHVMQEIFKLKNKFNVKYIRFGDDTFTLNIDHIKGIKDGLKKANITDINFSIGSRIDTMDEKKLALLKDMNVYNISFGVETGSKRMIQLIDKRIDLDTVVPTIKMVNNLGISTVTYFIINHPEETIEDMKASMQMIKDLNKNCPLNIVSLNTAFPYPGTDWWDYCEKKDLLSKINMYKYSYKYNHQTNPIINMSAVPTADLIKMIKKIERVNITHLFSVNFKKAVKMCIKDPKRLINKLKT